MEKKKERRRHPRINYSLVVSYRLMNEAEIGDISQSANLSRGGMLLTTNKFFPKGTFLKLYMKLPSARKKISLVGKVVSCQELTRGMIYKTRLSFYNTPQEIEQMFSQALGEIKKHKRENV